MDNRISEIRESFRSGVYDLRAGEDIRYLLNQLGRQGTRRPDSLQFMCDSIKAGRYPNPDDILALIDALEDSRATHIKDLEDIDDVVTKNFQGTSPTNPMAAHGWSVGRFVKARLEARRTPEQPSVIEVLREIDRELDRLTSPSTLPQFVWGKDEAQRIIRRKIARLQGISDE